MADELISREAAKKEIMDWAGIYQKPNLLDAEDTMSVLDNLPTVNAVEVVHGQWLDEKWNDCWQSMTATCSACRVRGEVRVTTNEDGYKVINSPHCPNCGARMDGERNEENPCDHCMSGSYRGCDGCGYGERVNDNND